MYEVVVGVGEYSGDGVVGVCEEFVWYGEVEV